MSDPSKALSTSFWNRNVNQTRFIRAEMGTEGFFREGEEVRYKFHYHIPALLDAIAQECSGRILEVGCGMANDLVELAKRGLTVYGIDLTEKGIELARRHFELRGLKADLRVADAEALPFESEYFDGVYSFGVLHHTPDTERAISEVHRTLRRGGKAYVMLYHKRSLNYFAHCLLKAPFDGTRQDPCPVEKAYSRTEVRKMFAPFSSVDIRVDYLFGTGWGIVNALLPTRLHRFLGKTIGWHLMIEATK